MFRKFIIALLAALPFATAFAQQTTGEWYSYPVMKRAFNNSGNGVETADGVFYFTTGNSLFSYDTKTNEVMGLTRRNGLNDNNVKSLFYNYQKKYLMVVYDNCNIDLVYDNGNVVNFSDIKDASMTSKVVNDVEFYGDRIYVSTSFGIVIFDEKKQCVVEAGNFGCNISGITIYRDNLIIFDRDNYAFYYAPVSGRHVSLSAFTKGGGGQVLKLFNISDDEGGVYSHANDGSKNSVVYHPITLDGDGKIESLRISVINDAAVKDTKSVWKGKDNKLYATNYSKLYSIKDGGVENTVNMYTQLTAPSGRPDWGYNAADVHTPQFVYSYDGNGMWLMTKYDGVGKYGITDGAPIVSYFTPECIILPKMARLRQNKGRIDIADDPNKGSIYVVNQSTTNYRNCMNQGNIKYDQGEVNYFDPYGNVEVRSLLEAPYVNSNTKSQQMNNNGYRILTPTSFGISRVEDDTYFMSSSFEGVYKVKWDKERREAVCQAKYDARNSYMTKSQSECFGEHTYLCEVDRFGNLWTMTWDSGRDLKIGVLPAEYTKVNTMNFTDAEHEAFKSHWVVISDEIINNLSRAWDIELLSPENSNFIYILRGYQETVLLIYDTKGTPDFSDDTWVSTQYFTDQDNKNYSLNHSTSLICDNKGRVWVGGDNGVIQLPQVVSITQGQLPSQPVTRLKVPRNDGTGYADYLLESEEIMSMTVDAANRKWVGTKASGLYLVSEDGDAVLEQFTPANSGLPDYQCTAVMADQLSNKLYIVNGTGVTVYNTDSSPASPDYNDVYAFPNPVRPDYTGWITINGLMADSFVKITDISNNCVAEGDSNGGTFMWDGCNRDGSRVKSGVYLVYASLKSEGQNQGKMVTKILVVN